MSENVKTASGTAVIGEAGPEAVVPVAALQPVKILVLQRGWVAIGRHAKDGAEHVLTDASIVRRWGTSKGLGQLASSGPTSSTVLDPTGVVRAHELATVLVIDADASVWADRL